MLRLLILLCLFVTQPIFAENKVIWTRSYEEAVEKAQGNGKRIVLFFTGSDWCGWCNRLQHEVLNTEDFSNAIMNKAIFVYVDFPMKTPLTEQEKGQNEKLKEKYSIRSFPSLVVLDERERLIGQTGYRPGGGKQYAGHLLKMINEYDSYQQKLSDLDPVKLSGKELKRMYQKAKELAKEEDANRILRIGVFSDQKQYFLTEKYRALAEEGMIHDDETLALKALLLSNDQNNNQLTHYQIAVIDFEAYCEEMAREGYSPEIAVAPLVEYISQYGKTDPDNLWRLQMVISQVYLDKNDLEKSLQYAESSYLSAPPSIQKDIAEAITNIRNFIQQESSNIADHKSSK